MITFFPENVGLFNIHRWYGEVSKGSLNIFEPFSYSKKVLETMSNFWPIGSGRLKLGRLAGLLQGF